MRDEILSREEIQRLLERNNAHPELGRPVSELCFTGKATEPNFKPERMTQTYSAWSKRLSSATFRVQSRGAKEAKVVMRPIKLKSGWTEVPLNGRS